MPVRTLTTRALNRALLARQLLLGRATVPIETAIEQIGGLQTQYAPSGYVALWSRVLGFRRETLTRALDDRTVIQGTLMRSTIHMVSRREFWLYAMGVRRARRTWSLRARRGAVDESAMDRAAAQLRDALGGGPRTVKDLGAVAAGFSFAPGLWVDLVRVPPSGTWDRRRADLLGLAESWVGPPDATEDEGLAHLVRAYLRGFGPANWRDIASWAGIGPRAAKEAGEALDLAEYRDEDGRLLVDLPGAPLPDPGTPAPVRFLPHWEPSLLVHARRTGLLPEEYRPRIFTTKNPFSVGTYLVDGRVAGAWSLRENRVVLDPYEPLSDRDRHAVEEERAALEAFHA